MQNSDCVRQHQNIFFLHYPDARTLQAAFMPGIKNGGLFVPCNDSHKLGAKVFLFMRFLDEPEPLAVSGSVVWITPAEAQGQRVPGIGIRLNDREGRARAALEKYLTGVKEKVLSFTM